MSWVCPYQINNECTRLKKACQPLQDGCVMEGKAAFIDSPLDRVNENRAQKEKNQKRNVRLPSAAQPQPNFLYESGEIASEKTLAMTATMHFDGTLHVVIASEAKQSFTHKKRHLLKEVCEKTYKKKKFLYSNTIRKREKTKMNPIVYRDTEERLFAGNSTTNVDPEPDALSA